MKTVVGIFRGKQGRAAQVPQGEDGSSAGLCAGRPDTVLPPPVLRTLQLGAEGLEWVVCVRVELCTLSLLRQPQ